MGEIAVKLLNYIGLTGVIFGFIANLSNPLSAVIGIGSAMFLAFKVLKERENWLFRRSERRKHEKENHTNDHPTKVRNLSR